MKTTHVFRNMVTIQVTGAVPEDFLSQIAAHCIPFRNLTWIDPVTIQLDCAARDLSHIRKIGKKTMCQTEILQATGFYTSVRAAGIRVLYPAVLAALCLLVFWIQGHILFFQVTGNDTVPDAVILRALEDHDITIGTSAASIDQDSLKVQMLYDLPDLRLFALNVHGCRAEVVVRERTERPQESESSVPAHLVAAQGGMILGVDAVQGSAVVHPGDLVEPGDLLISGVTDLDRIFTLCRAKGEVYAKTWRPFQTVFPKASGKKRYTGRKTERILLLLGKNIIKIRQTSGISYDRYDKITKTIPLTLPGGFTAPISLSIIAYQEYELVPDSDEIDYMADQNLALDMLRKSLIAGLICKPQLERTELPGGYVLHGTVECQEEIGMIQEIIE